MAAVKRGYYYTDYGNTCFVSGPNAKTAKDLDSGDRIPISMVDFTKPARVGLAKSEESGK